MKTKIKVEIPAKIDERDDKIICDICKKEKHAYSRNWNNETFEVQEIQVSSEIGSSYPEGSYGKRTIYDICPECFVNKVMVFFDSIGVKPRVEEYDY